MRTCYPGSEVLGAKEIKPWPQGAIGMNAGRDQQNCVEAPCYPFPTILEVHRWVLEDIPSCKKKASSTCILRESRRTFRVWKWARLQNGVVSFGLHRNKQEREHSKKTLTPTIMMSSSFSRSCSTEISLDILAATHNRLCYCACQAL